MKPMRRAQPSHATPPSPRLVESSSPERSSHPQRSAAESVWLSGAFLGGLGLKVAASFFFASSYLTDLFTPFVNWFVVSGFKNPWEFFHAAGSLKMFPYPTAMLWIMAVPRFLASPFLAADWQVVTPLHLAVMRVPLLAFDILALAVLLSLLPARKQKVIALYWFSPVVFFVSYVHGQLDIIPTALFLTSVLLLVRRKLTPAVLLLALAASTKSHIFISVPFVFIFLYKQRVGWARLGALFATFVAAYSLLVLPYAFSPAFRQMVFNAPEQKRFYEFMLPISPTLSLVICPTVVALAFIKFASYKKLNREILLMFLGVVFASLVVLVTPMPGWFVWSLPFLVYFLIANKEYSRAPFILYNAVYVVYFLAFFERKTPLLPVPFDAQLANNLALSLLMSSVGFIVFWMFELGIARNEALKMKEAPLLIGIGGDSGSGKHTLFEVLRNLLGAEASVPIFGDNFHRWERGDENWKITTHLNPSGNRLHEGMDLAVALRDGRSVELAGYDHATGRFTAPKKIEPSKFAFFIGLHPFYLKRMRELLDVKIFMEPDETLRQCWKVRRDVAQRGHEKSNVLDQIASRREDSSRFIKPQKEYADLIVQYAPLQPIDPAHPPGPELAVRTRYELDNSIDLQGLLGGLQAVKTLKTEYSTSLTTQELTVEGTASEQEIRQIAYNLELNFDELLLNKPAWLAGPNGVTQLVFLLIYNHKMEAKSDASGRR